MSNDLILNEGAFDGKAPIKVADPGSDSLSDGIGGGYAIIRFKGSKWALSYNKDTQYFTRVEGGKQYPQPFIDVVILKQSPHLSKTYYPEGSFEAQNADRPSCSSMDGIMPDPGVKEKQADACALCPRNQWYSKPDGKRARDCKDNKRLAVLILPELTKALMGSPLMEPAFLRIPGDSLKALSDMGKVMERKGWHYSSFVTRVEFDITQSHPKMIFTAVQPLTEDEKPVVKPLLDDPMTLRIVGENKTFANSVSPMATGIAHQPAMTPVRQPVVVPITAAVKPAPVMIEATANPVGQTAADIGEIEDASSDMDARIAALLK